MPQSTRRAFPPAPSEPNILVIDAHPAKQSLIGALVVAYLDGAGPHVSTEHLRLRDLNFSLSRSGGYGEEDDKIEPDLVRAQQAIAAASHLVVAFPLWWGSTPALLKGFFDRTLLPGWAFAMDPKTNLPKGGLAGRTGRVIQTMDAPIWYDALKNRGSGRRQVKNATLQFCGLRPVKISTFGGVSASTLQKREAWLAQMTKTGERDATSLRKRFAQHQTQTTLLKAST